MNRRMGDNARIRMQEAVGTWDDCAARYVRIYNDLLAGQA